MYGMNAADFVIAQTSIQAELLRTNFSIEVHKVIPNFQPSPQRTDKKGDAFTVLWIANLKTAKRPQLFIEVVRLLQDLPELRFRMIGTPYGNAKVQEAYVNTVRSLSNVEYLGGLEQQEVNAHLSKSHLLVNTSVTEGFSNTFIQAWMRNVPVLTIGINPDNLFDDGIFGRCCSNVQELADTIRFFSANPRELEKIASRSHKTSVEMFSMSNAEKLSDFITSAALGTVAV
jgi:glycosyltransferase involved in cell wall biosynthesis